MQRFFHLSLLAALVVLSVGSALAQNAYDLFPGPDLEFRMGSPKARATCSDQVLAYGSAKATGLQTLSINNVTSAQAAGQWFEAPAPTEITGANFYAFLNEGGVPVTATVALYASDGNRLPLGSPLATATLVVSNGLGGATLDELRQTVTFAAPVLVDGPFVIAVENRSPDSVVLVSNSYASADGAGEFLASADIAGTWLSGSALNVGGTPFDADWLFEPIARVELVPEVTASPVCLTETATVAFSANSPYLESRFFNAAAFLGLAGESYEWDFGDGSPVATGADQSHEYTFVPDTVFTATLTATLFPLGSGPGCPEVVIREISTLATCELLFSDRFE